MQRRFILIAAVLLTAGAAGQVGLAVVGRSEVVASADHRLDLTGCRVDRHQRGIGHLGVDALSGQHLGDRLLGLGL